MTPFDVADALRACLELSYAGSSDIPGEICHRPGDQAPLSAGLSQDECCAGLAWVRIAGIEPVVDPLASEEVAFNPCSTTGRRITLELGVARCNPFGDAAKGPTCEQWTELALLMDQDASAMRRAVCCFQENAVDDYDPSKAYRVLGGAWEPIESSGACAGGIMTVVVWVNCSEC